MRHTISITQRVVVRVLHQHVGEFDFGAVHILTGNDHGKLVIDQASVMSEDVSNLCRQIGR